MEINKIYNESCLDTINKMPDNFLDCIITSPPYWQLRDYGYPEQWGLEPTFQEYLQHLWSMMDALFPKLKSSATVWINLGDTYNSSLKGNRNGFDNTTWDKAESEKERSKKIGTSRKIDKNKLPSKTLLLLPHRFAIGCIDRGYIIRNDIIWAKRNGMPESVTDRFSKKHEYFFFMVKSERYFFDLDIIKQDLKQVSIERYKRGVNENKYTDGAGGQSAQSLCQPRPNVTTKIPKEQAEMFGSPRARQHRSSHKFDGNKGDGQDRKGIYSGNEYTPPEDGKNPGSVSDFWDISTKPSSEKHYASYNDSLLVKPILAGCPKGGIIYDPFMGTGSTGEAAIRSGRNFIGSEMSKEYCDIAEKRLQPYLNQTMINF